MVMRRPGTRLSLLQRFTLVSALITLALAVTLSVVTVRAVTAFAVQDDAHVATELVLRTFSPQLRPEDFQGALPATRRVLLDSLFRAHGISDKILRVRLWRTDGRLLYSNTTEAEALEFIPADLATREGYQRFVLARQGMEGEAPGQARVFVPVQMVGSTETLGAFEIFYDLTLLQQRLAYIRRLIWTLVPGGLFLLYASVFVLVRRTSRTLLKQQADLVAAYLGTFRALATAIDAKDSYTGDHSSRVSEWAVALGRVLGVEEEALTDLRMAARLHDVGKIAIPLEILHKSGPLDEEEWRIMRRHPVLGADLLSRLPSSNRLPMIVAFEHHMRFDTRGYPFVHASWTQHPVSRLACVADVFDAMTSRRAYKKAMPSQDVCAYVRDEASRIFDPRLARILNLMVEQLGEETRVDMPT